MAITGKFTYKRAGEIRDVHYPKTDGEKFILHWEGGRDPHEIINATNGWVAGYGEGADGEEHQLEETVAPPDGRTSWGGGGPDYVRVHAKDPRPQGREEGESA
ncbi:hypothetical protein AB0H73_06895 [Streptomyces olivoreticuli]